ncbi:MAG: DUF2892 domain-containing protein [Candidatus Sumerlaeia bacterium]|nr:DUF2892 domain-containing protein [Candidatus Sumerlaeia bacterium]
MLRPKNLTRLLIGIMILVGLKYSPTLVWLVGIMMLFAGITGVCLLEVLLIRILGRPAPKEGEGESAGWWVACG